MLLISQDVRPFLANIKGTRLFIQRSQSPVTCSDSLSAQNSPSLYIVVWRNDAQTTMYRRPERICLRDTTPPSLTHFRWDQKRVFNRSNFFFPRHSLNLVLTFFFLIDIIRIFYLSLLPPWRITKSIKIRLKSWNVSVANSSNVYRIICQISK